MLFPTLKISAQNTFPATGNVGIGTSSPLALLNVSGNGAGKDNYQSVNGNMLIQAKTGGRYADKGAQLEFVIPANTDGSNPWGQARLITVAGNANSSDATGMLIIGTRRKLLKNGISNWNYGDDIVVGPQGNVGIGTLNPTAKLAVNGNVKAREVNVTVGTSDWPDYVFDKSYQLPSLDSLSEHIGKLGHLPGMPSARDVKKNGIDLGEMNRKLLEKVEELTVYAIRQESEIKELKEKNKLYESLLHRVAQLESTSGKSTNHKHIQH